MPKRNQQKRMPKSQGKKNAPQAEDQRQRVERNKHHHMENHDQNTRG